MTAPPDPFADLDGELNFIELNNLLETTSTTPVYSYVNRRLERWAEYYDNVAHRGEIYDIMTGVVLPFLQEQLKNEPVQNIRLSRPGNRNEYLARGGNIIIVADTYRMVTYEGGEGAGSYAPHEPKRQVNGTIRVMAYDAHTARLVNGRTWSEINGVAESVDWFGIEDLILWPKLIFELSKFSIRTLPKVIKFGGKAAVASGKLIYSGFKQAGKTASKLLSSRKWKALLKLEQALADLVKINVRLGAQKALQFEAITAAEACKRLFSQPLSALSRLAQHWPSDLAKQYLEEIKSLILKGVKNSPIEKEAAEQLAKSQLGHELFVKLPQNLQKAVKALVEKRWDSIRKAFWRRVANDPALVAELEKMGVKFGSIGTAPVLNIAGKKLKITLDHVARKVENPLQAFDPANLRAASTLENTVLKEGLVRDVKELSGLSLDDLSTFGDPLPKGFAEDLAAKVESWPDEDFLFRGLDWVNPPATIPQAKVVK